MIEPTREPSLKNKIVDNILDALKATTEYPVPTKGYDNSILYNTNRYNLAQDCIATDYDISMKYHMIESTALTKALDKLAPKKEAAT